MMLYPDGTTNAPRVSSPFGPRKGGAFSIHYGADLIGFTTIHAIAAGLVTFAGWMNNAAGYTVVIDHGGGITSLYMHNATHHVRRGDRIPEGHPIATMGKSGNATGNCCHLEIRVHGTSVEPVGYVRARITAVPTGAATAPQPESEEDDDMKLIRWNESHVFGIDDGTIFYVPNTSMLADLEAIYGKAKDVDDDSLTAALLVRGVHWDPVDAVLRGEAPGSHGYYWSRVMAEGIAIRGELDQTQKTLEDVRATATSIPSTEATAG